MSNEPKWLVHARKDLGIKEIEGSASNPRIMQMFGYTSYNASGDHDAWCSAATCAWFEEQNITSPRSAAARSWLDWGAPCEPFVGAVCILHRGSGQRYKWRPGKEPYGLHGQFLSGHVGLVVSVSDDHVVLLSGNMRNSVTIDTFSRRKVLGFRWPEHIPLPQPELEEVEVHYIVTEDGRYNAEDIRALVEDVRQMRQEVEGLRAARDRLKQRADERGATLRDIETLAREGRG